MSIELFFTIEYFNFESQHKPLYMKYMRNIYEIYTK